MFFHILNMLFESWYPTHFLLYEYCKHMLSRHFLNYNFHIILNNDTRKSPTKQAILPCFVCVLYYIEY